MIPELCSFIFDYKISLHFLKEIPEISFRKNSTFTFSKVKMILIKVSGNPPFMVIIVPHRRYENFQIVFKQTAF